MDSVPIPILLAALLALLIFSGFFSMSETAMMASNRHRLRHLAKQGNRGARLAMALLDQTDKLLGVILLGNTLINAAAATLTSYIALAAFGDGKWSLEIGTLAITFGLLVVSEITPKVVGATYPDRLSMAISYVLSPLLKVLSPLIWFINLFVDVLLRTLHLKPKAGHEAPRLSPEELRGLVLEAGHFIPPKHRSILVNLLDLELITVDDVMKPRNAIEGLDLDAEWNDLVSQIITCYHSRLPVYRGDLANMAGILPIKRLIPLLQRGELSRDGLLEHLQPPYFIPAATPVFTQLQFFQENKQRIGLVVDEYGEIQGLVTLEDIVEEFVGEFTTSTPSAAGELAWEEGSALIEGSRSLREINRKLNTALPTDGPKTLNGLIIEHFQDIPEAGVSIKIAGVAIEIVQTQDRSIKTARLFRPSPAPCE